LGRDTVKRASAVEQANPRLLSATPPGDGDCGHKRDGPWRARHQHRRTGRDRARRRPRSALWRPAATSPEILRLIADVRRGGLGWL